MSGNNTHFLLHFLDIIIATRMTYSDIKANDELRKTSTFLGKRALIYEIVFIVLAAGGAALLMWGLGLVDSTTFVFGLIIIIVAAAMFIVALIYLLLALNCAIKQLCLNRRAIGWITLFLPIAAIVAGVVVLGLVAEIF